MTGLIEKWARFFRHDGQGRFKIAFVGLLAALTLGQGYVIKIQGKELARVKSEKSLVERIPEMQGKVRSKDLAGLKPESQIAMIQTILEGTSYRDGVYQAVIDGAVYREGEMIGDYQISKITMRSIVLTNAARNDTRRLYFPGQSEEEGEQQ